MSSPKPLRLTFELLSDEEIDQFSIHSKREIQFILKAIAKHGSQVALYYGSRETFILTTLIDADSGGLWLEASQNQKDNEHIAKSRKFYFVSAHQHVKVQFEADQIETDDYDGMETFYMALPATVMRIQRRDTFRLSLPIANPLKCLIPIDSPAPDRKKHAYTIADISTGGVALILSEHESPLEDGKIYSKCQIPLPDDDVIEVSLQVRNMFPVTKPNGETVTRIGCKFVDLDGRTEMILQRYITQLQLQTIKM